MQSGLSPCGKLTEMVEQKDAQLDAVCAACRELGAEVCRSPEHHYFTATVWDGWEWPYDEGPALAVQQEI